MIEGVIDVKETGGSGSREMVVKMDDGCSSGG